MKIAGLVLAGGLSLRMRGENKALKRLGGQTMIARAIERLDPQVAALAVNANRDAEVLGGYGLPVLADVHPGFAGPLAGVLTGLAWAAGLGGFGHVATAACDTPFFPADLVARLAAEAAGERIVLACSASGRHPAFGLWPVSLRDDLAQWLANGETRKVQAYVARREAAWVEFAPAVPGGADPFFNANTPEDFAQAEAMLWEGRA